VELKFAMLADYVTETKGGKFIIVGEFDHIFGTKVPARHQLMFLVARFEASVTEGSAHKLKVVLVDEDGNDLPLTVPELDANFAAQGPGKPLRANVIIQLVNLVFPKFGSYEFHILIDGHHKATIGFELTNAQPPRR